MAVTKRSDVINTYILEEAIQAEFAGAVALYGSPAVVQNNSLPANNVNGGKMKGGETIQVPYFNNLGELDEIATDGDSLTPVALTMSDETATIRHFGKAVELTTWSQIKGLYADPYKECARQLVMAAKRKWDEVLIATAGASLPADNIHDVWNAVTPVLLNWDVMVDAKLKFGDEQSSIVMLSVHSKVYGDIMKLKDTTGRPLLVDANDGSLPKFMGIPVKVSDRNAVVPAAGGTPAKYKSRIYKAGALALWLNGQPSVKEDEDILKDTDLVAIHTYFVAHRYKRTPGATRPGVVEIVTN
ncbi:phage major capsid protein [Sorangium sp. So ce1024]|uniref:phage major capsid protein n=1 Tax=Sorangium sp. So ce1024 TaxID=3133327 RepID=UPI003F0FA05C